MERKLFFFWQPGRFQRDQARSHIEKSRKRKQIVDWKEQFNPGNRQTEEQGWAQPKERHKIFLIFQHDSFLSLFV